MASSNDKNSSNKQNSAQEFHSGDTVQWNTAQGKTQGKVVKKLTSDTHIKGHQVRASADEPQYLVESEKTGNQAAHKPDALEKAN
ncbi:MAG: DUF2945 domain-containing protein [Leptolyngbyaceae bacterium]|nr:DUF2945 domain-containing protein [Leptolyngbyaceae bacterium]